MSAEVATVFAHWEQFLGWLLERTEKFPKRVAYTVRSRIDNLALEVMERLIEARYCRERGPILARLNLDFEKLRLLLRLSHRSRILDTRAFERACAEIDTAGRMVGGWQRHGRTEVLS